MLTTTPCVILFAPLTFRILTAQVLFIRDGPARLVEIALQHLLQHIGSDRLRQVIVHAGFQALFAISADGTSGHGDHQYVSHLWIRHKMEWVALFARFTKRIYSLLSIAEGLTKKAKLLHKVYGYLLIDWIILGDADLELVARNAGQTDDLPAILLCWWGKEKETAVPTPGTSATIASCSATVRLREREKELLLLLFGNTNARILDRDRNIDVLIILRVDARVNGDTALGSKLVGIRHQVHQNLVKLVYDKARTTSPIVSKVGYRHRHELNRHVPLALSKVVSCETLARNMDFAFAASSFSRTISMAFASAAFAFFSASRA
ncbi:hypothetical protein KC330_g103 [Hortaea werneckii]|nr:hypothetical protein KC330_g103 [Hortaea werneckii]